MPIVFFFFFFFFVCLCITAQRLMFRMYFRKVLFRNKKKQKTKGIKETADSALFSPSCVVLGIARSCVVLGLARSCVVLG